MMSLSLFHKPPPSPLQNSTFNQTSLSIPKTKKLFPQLPSKNYTISLQNLSNPLTTLPKNTKSFVWNLQDRAKICPERRRKVAHVLRNQISLSKLKLIFDSKRPFESMLFSSQIKHLPSLDTLELEFNKDLASIFKVSKLL